MRDPLGHQIHTALAMLHLALLPAAPAPEAISFAMLLVYALIRLPHTRWCYTAVLGDRVLTPLFAFALFLALSTAWSIDPVEGWTEVKAFRMLLMPLALWPVLDRVPWLIGAFLVGVFGMNLVQLAQEFGFFNLDTEGMGRARAGLHPIQTGAMCLAALTFHLAGLLSTPWRARHVGHRAWLPWALGAGALLAATGLVLAGSRGPWIAAIVALPSLWLTHLLAWPAARRKALVLGGAAIIVAIVGWLALGSVIRQRVDNARIEYAQAMEGDYLSGVGQRLIMWQWADRFFRASPLYGTGAGSFRKLTRETPEYAVLLERTPSIQRSIARGEVRDGRITAAHPHSAYLHAAYATGSIGLALLVLSLAFLAIRTVRDPRDHLFARASPFVLLGWLLGAQFDTYTLNGHLLGLLMLVASIVWPGRPIPRINLEAVDDDDEQAIGPGSV